MLSALVLAVVSSAVWIIYIVAYISGQLHGQTFSALPASDFLAYVGLVLVPVWVMWQIYGMVHRYFRDQDFDERMRQLFNLTKKNQDYTDLIVRVMLDAEHEIKDGFVVNKFDVFIADINELLADIAQRCNVSSSMQMEQLWSRVKNGERWVIGKTLIEAAQREAGFNDYLAEKASKDHVFKGTLLEFCSRYQNLCALLEKHDRDRVFLTILETGVLGKVYSMLAPAAEATDLLPLENPAPCVSPTVSTKPEESKPSIWRKLITPREDPKAETAVSEEETKEADDDEQFFSVLRQRMEEPENEDTPAEEAPRLDMNLAGQEEDPAENKLSDTTEDFGYPFGGWLNENNAQK